MQTKEMVTTIRHGVFETNSSSTHSLTLLTDEEYLANKNAEYVDSNWNAVPTEKVEEEWEKEKEDVWLGMEDEDEKQEAYEEWLRNNDWYTQEMYDDTFNDGYETYHEQRTLPNGEIIHAVGYYGYC